MLLGPDAPKLELERCIQTMYSDLANRRSTLSVATQASLLKQRLLIIFTLDTRARDPKGGGRLGFRLSLGLWIDRSVVPDTTAPVSHAFTMLMAWIAELLAKGEFTEEVATEFVALCFQDGYSRNVLPRERIDALLRDFETQFGLAGQASPRARADRAESLRWAKRFHGEIYFWPTIKRATEFLEIADAVLVRRTGGQATERLVGSWIQLAALATLLALGAAARPWLPSQSQVMIRVLISLISLVGEVLVVTMMKASVPPRPPNWGTANRVRLDGAIGDYKLPLHVRALVIILSLVFVLILASASLSY